MMHRIGIVARALAFMIVHELPRLDVHDPRDLVEGRDERFIGRPHLGSTPPRRVSISGMLEPCSIIHVAADLVALLASRHEIRLDAWPSLFPTNKMIDGQRNIVVGAITATIPVALEDLPRNNLIELPLALAGDCLDDRAVFGLGEDLRLQEVRLPEKRLPLGQTHSKQGFENRVRVLFAGKEDKKRLAFSLVNGPNHLDGVADLEKV